MNRNFGDARDRDASEDTTQMEAEGRDEIDWHLTGIHLNETIYEVERSIANGANRGPGPGYTT